jgi:hypothetical protein
VHGQHQLLDVVGTLRSRSGLTNLLHGWQQQADQDGDDGDHHQQLDQREAKPHTTSYHRKTPLVKKWDDRHNATTAGAASGCGVIILRPQGKGCQYFFPEMIFLKNPTALASRHGRSVKPVAQAVKSEVFSRLGYGLPSLATRLIRQSGARQRAQQRGVPQRKLLYSPTLRTRSARAIKRNRARPILYLSPKRTKRIFNVSKLFSRSMRRSFQTSDPSHSRGECKTRLFGKNASLPTLEPQLAHR